MKHRTGTRPLLAALAVAALLGAGAPAALAQSGEGRSQGTAEETLEALLIVTLKRDLALDTAAAVDLAGKVRVMIEARRDFVRQQIRLRRDLQEAVRSEAPDTANIDRLIGSLFELRASFPAEQQRHFTELTRDMDPVQRGKLFASLEEFEDRVRKHLRRLDDGKGPGRRRDRGPGGADDGL